MKTEYTFEHHQTYTAGVGSTFTTWLCFLGCREQGVTGCRTKEEGERRARDAYERKLACYERLLRGA